MAAREVVAGDLLRLVAGDVVSADARLLRSESLEVDEAALTGESVPAAKAARVVHGADTPLADRAGMVHAGTVITRGRADAVVTGTGSRSALGTIAQLLDERRAPLTPLQRRLARLGRQLSLGAAVLCLVVAALGVLRGNRSRTWRSRRSVWRLRPSRSRCRPWSHCRWRLVPSGWLAVAR